LTLAGSIANLATAPGSAVALHAIGSAASLSHIPNPFPPDLQAAAPVSVSEDDALHGRKRSETKAITPTPSNLPSRGTSPVPPDDDDPARVVDSKASDSAGQHKKHRRGDSTLSQLKTADQTSAPKRRETDRSSQETLNSPMWTYNEEDTQVAKELSRTASITASALNTSGHRRVESLRPKKKSCIVS
jgi:hypothetical protein